MTRPLSPIPIIAMGVIATAILWSSDVLDDLVVLAPLVTVCHLLVWLGLRGPPQAIPSVGARVALAVGAAIPATSVVLMLIPWLAAGKDGMAGLGVVVGVIVFGMPLALVALGTALYLQSRRSRIAALGRVVATTSTAIAAAWLLGITWLIATDVTVHDRLEMLGFPALATWWLVLVIAEHRAPRSVT